MKTGFSIGMYLFGWGTVSVGILLFGGTILVISLKSKVTIS